MFKKIIIILAKGFHNNFWAQYEEGGLNSTYSSHGPTYDILPYDLARL